jgi:hypothetical protein
LSGDRLCRRPSVALPADHRGRARASTRCTAGKFAIPDQDHAAELYEVTQEVTAARGLPAYEISNHARPGAESRHNLTYWRYGEYVGVGPGAHGRFVEDGARRHHRRAQAGDVAEPGRGAQGHGVTGGESLTRSEEADEFLLMGLRLDEGIDLDRYESAGGPAAVGANASRSCGRRPGRAGRQFAAARHAAGAWWCSMRWWPIWRGSVETPSGA